MALYLNEDLEYVVNDYLDMDDFDDYGFGERNVDRPDHVGDEDLNKHKSDTSASEFRKGKDLQGIPWDRLNHSREKYREMRLKQYKNYENLSRSREALEKVFMKVKADRKFYDFQFNTRLVKPTIVHFQGKCPLPLGVLDPKHGGNEYFLAYKKDLRDLLWATSKHDVYMTQNYSVMHWSSLLQRGKEMLNVSGNIVPIQKRFAQPLSRIQISTMAVRDNLMVAGGFQGELVCKFLNQPGVTFCTKVTNDDNAITNAVDSYRTPNGSLRVIAANNDSYVRIFDGNNFTLLNRLSYSWSVNNTSVSPDGKLLAVLGDSTECLIADAQSGKLIGTLKGHLDYSFASAWHPDGNILATGNQDTTCRLWDVRKLSESVAVLKGRMGAIRGIKFSSDGRFMAMAEPADFVHVFDHRSGYCEAQEIDLFGEIAGISFSPDTETLFVGIADRTYGSLLEFKRTQQFGYLDSL